VIEELKLLLSLVSTLISLGIFGLLFKLNVQWSQIVERLDVLWEAYCEEHNVPFKSISKAERF